MTKEYLGILRAKNSLIPLNSYPVLWLVEDAYGGFNRFKTKLDLNNLRFTCSLVPVGDVAIAEALGALTDECSSLGKNQTKPIPTFNILLYFRCVC